MKALLAIQWAYDTPHYEEWIYVIVGIVVFGAIATICAKVFSKPDRHYGYNEPRALFGELCRAHGLRWKQRRVLKQLAREHKLSNADEIFLRPDLFGGGRGKSQAERLRQVLFEDPSGSADERT